MTNTSSPSSPPPPRSISSAASANRDVDHLLNVGGDPVTAQKNAMHDRANTGSITGLTQGQGSGDVTQNVVQTAVAVKTAAFIAPPAPSSSQPAQAQGNTKEKTAASDVLTNGIKTSMAYLKDNVKLALEGLNGLEIPPAQDVPVAKLGTNTPAPAAIVPQPQAKEQVASR